MDDSFTKTSPGIFCLKISIFNFDDQKIVQNQRKVRTLFSNKERFNFYATVVKLNKLPTACHLRASRSSSKKLCCPDLQHVKKLGTIN